VTVTAAGGAGLAGLILSEGDLNAVVAHACACEPAECCGVLAGASNGRVVRVYPMTNTAGSPTEFVMDPEEQFRVFDDIAARELVPIAVYHSHPASPAEPSPRDVARAFYPEMAWLIVSLSESEPVCRAHHIVEDQVTEIPVRVVPGIAGATGPATVAVHGGQRPDPATGARATPIYLSTSFVFPSAAEAAARFGLESDGHIYARISDPTTAVLEERMGALERGVSALVTASGQAAEFIAAITLAGAGENIVSSTSLYGGSWTLFAFTLARLGIAVRFAPLNDLDAFAGAIDERTRAVYCETIGNPALDVADIAGLAAVAHKAGVPLVVDNTFAGPFVCRPLELGADILVESLTKYVGGHGTVLGGVVVDGGRFDWGEARFGAITSPDLSYAGLRFAERFAPGGFVAKARYSVLRDVGASISPMNSFFLLQGLESAHLRAPRYSQNAAVVAGMLADHPAVERVSYPGLPEHATHRLAQRQFIDERFGGMVGFVIRGGREAGARFIDKLHLVSHLANLGDSKTLVVHPASTTHAQLSSGQLEAAGIEPGFIRLSVGLETLDDVLADLDQALAV